MKRFVVPPSWPSPPRRNWIPPKTWRPDPSWPPAPEGWKFWVDGKGEPVLGPIGRYAAPSRRAAYAAAAAMIVFVGVNLWAVLVIGHLGDPDDSAVVTFAEESPSAGPVSSTSPAVPRTTSTPPLVPRTTLVPSKSPTPRPTQRPTRKTTATKTTERTTPTPTPTRATTSTATAKPSRPTSSPSTREELLRQYCIDRGIDPAWCDPANWEQTP
ncbi:hypothetical protein EV649_2602 [Kribbella sp. VKM Ac-2569]|uniref:hypothetical protein n=1 Tax=Kribbella sp. VKM Ac-2569 TaxID=2512220 RepID=UPI00102D0F6F|nr:hypothetical protein [Kribbella sp. VKM Ac-2569]RZT28818.1 hypothetical protein EV649_2602 [Kribbella sp. VKM Ac-2569]